MGALYGNALYSSGELFMFALALTPPALLKAIEVILGAGVYRAEGSVSGVTVTKGICRQ